MNRTTTLLLFATLFASGCAGKVLPAVCVDDTIREARRKDPKVGQWIAAMLRGPDRDCRGVAVKWPPLDKKCLRKEPLQDSKAIGELTAEEVIVERYTRDERLVWVTTRSYANGEALGPVGLVALGERDVRIVALGTLRAMGTKTSLKLLDVGNHQILAAEGEHCKSKSNPTTCRRTVRFIPRFGPKLIARPFEDERRKCYGPAVVDLARQRVTRIDRGWERRFILNANYEIKDGIVVVHDQVIVQELDPRRPDSTLREVQRAEEDWTIQWNRGRLVMKGSPLWERMNP